MVSMRTLLPTSTELLQNVRRYSQDQSPELIWSDLLRWLVTSAGAEGGQIDFAADGVATISEGAFSQQARADLIDTSIGGVPGGGKVHSTDAGVLLIFELCQADGAPLARLALEFRPDCGFAPEDVRLLDAALQVVAQSTQTDGELREARERLNRFRHLYEVGQVIASTLDLDQVLRQSTLRVAEVLRAESSTLMLVDQPHQELVFKIPAGPAEAILQEKRMPIDKGVAGWVATQGEPLIIEDAESDHRFYGDVDRMTGYRTRSIMAVPLQVKGNIIGVVEVINKIDGGSFSLDDLQWLSILTPLIAVAIDNARLFAQERQRVSELMAANTVALALNETLELPVILRSALLTTMNVLRAEAGEIALLNPHTHTIESQVSEGADAALPDQVAGAEKELARWIVEHGRPLILPELSLDERTTALQAVYPGVRSYAGVPLIARENIVGVMSVMTRQTGAFDAAQLSLLDTIGRQIGLALENGRLYAALREERDRIVTAEEKVRHELARNLHDGPAQIMAAIILNIDMARRQLVSKPERMATELNFIESLAQEANQEVRDLLFNLRPVSLETLGLVVALNQLAERIRAHAPYQVHLDVEAMPPGQIDPPVAGTLFVIVQEALNNIQKHAKAENVWVRLGTSATHLWVDVFDDGVGFDVHQTDASYAHLNSFGLLNMRERARLIDGETLIASPAPNLPSGTLVHVEVPLSRAYSNVQTLSPMLQG